MPAERLSHPSDGTSRKICALSDFEFRVWCQYKLSANDVGVMLNDPSPLIADNKALRQRKPGQVREALTRLIDLGLLVVFDHQGESYVCSLQWQDYQGIRSPRRSHLPVPDGAVLAACSAKTQELFGKMAEILRKKVRDPTEVLPETIGDSSVEVQTLAREPMLMHTQQLQQEGEPEREPAPARSVPPVHLAFRRFAERFEERAGQPPEFDRGKDAATFQGLVARHGVDAVLDAIDAFFVSKDAWIRQSGYTVGALKACFNKLTMNRPKPVSPSWREHCASLGHAPPCGTPQTCRLKQAQQQPREASA